VEIDLKIAQSFPFTIFFSHLYHAPSQLLGGSIRPIFPSSPITICNTSKNHLSLLQTSKICQVTYSLFPHLPSNPIYSDIHVLHSHAITLQNIFSTCFRGSKFFEALRATFPFPNFFQVPGVLFCQFKTFFKSLRPRFSLSIFSESINLVFILTISYTLLHFSQIFCDSLGPHFIDLIFSHTPHLSCLLFHFQLFSKSLVPRFVVSDFSSSDLVSSMLYSFQIPQAA
jgi:hypothetical protein